MNDTTVVMTDTVMTEGGAVMTNTTAVMPDTDDRVAFNTALLTVAGRRHRSMGQDNEDCVKLCETDSTLILPLSDGASASSCASVASATTVAAAVELGQKPEIWDMKPKAIRDLFISLLDEHYFRQPYPFEELAATVTVVFINKIAERYIAISVGDSSCIMFDKALEPSLLLQPMNLFKFKDRTVFANSSLCNKGGMRIEMGSIKNVGGFMLITDGAEELLNEEHAQDVQQLAAMTILSPQHAQKELEATVRMLSDHTSDDITVAITMLGSDPELTRIAAATCNQSDLFSEEDTEPAVTAEAVPCSEPEPAADVPEDDIIIPEEAETPPVSLLGFLSVPRTAEELVIAGYVSSETAIITELAPFLREGLIRYDNHHFSI